MTPPRTDAELLSASVRDPAVFADVFARHGRELHSYLSRRLGQVADDMLNELFLVAFDKRGDYQARTEDCRPWLYGIAANLVRRQRRAEARHYRHLAETPVGPPDPRSADDWDQVDRRLDAVSTSRALAGALAELDPGDREVLLLLAWGGLTYAETAAALAVPIGTVRSRMHRARRRVRLGLDQSDPTSLHLTGDPR